MRAWLDGKRYWLLQKSMEKCAPLLHLVWPGWVDHNMDEFDIAVVREAGIGFVHVPKCAGSSIAQSLYGRSMGHRSWRWFRKIGVPTVAVIRDPVDRFLSAYDYLRSDGLDWSNRAIRRLYLDDDINRFVRRLDRNPHLRRYFHFETQAHYVADGDRVMVDELLPFEKLDERFPGTRKVNITRGHRTPPEALSGQSLATLRRIYAPDFALRARLGAG